MNHDSDYAPSIMSLVEAVNRHLKENGFLAKEALFETTEIVILEVCFVIAIKKSHRLKLDGIFL